MTTTNKTLDGVCLYTPQGAAREYAAVGCNFYRGCPYQCKYCYNRKGLTAGVMGVDHAVLESKFTNPKYRRKKYRNYSPKDYAFMAFVEELEKEVDYLRQTGIFYSFSTDPMCLECAWLTCKTSLYAISRGVPVRILTKNTYWPQDVVWQYGFLSPEEKQLVSFGFTLTGCDDWEPNASPNESRIKMMHRLHEEGFKTFASIEPVVDFESSFRMIKSTLGFCDLYMIGLMSHIKDYYKTSAEGSKFFNRIYYLHQIMGIKVYYKHSARKTFSATLDRLYQKEKYPKILPLKDVYSIPTSESSLLVSATLALYTLNRHNGLLHHYEYLDSSDVNEDIFLFRMFVMKFGWIIKEDIHSHIFQGNACTGTWHAPLFREVAWLESEAMAFLDFLKTHKEDDFSLPEDSAQDSPLMLSKLIGLTEKLLSLARVLKKKADYIEPFGSIAAENNNDGL